MDYKQLKIMTLALSLPGAILTTGFIYSIVKEKKILSDNLAIALFSLILVTYILFIVKILFNMKNETK